MSPKALQVYIRKIVLPPGFFQDFFALFSGSKVRVIDTFQGTGNARLFLA
jgi:hypothetical protein